MNQTIANVNLNGFAQVCHSISESKGWTALKRTDTQLCNLMISECIEALEDFRDNHPLNEIYYENNKKNPLRCTTEHLKTMTPEARNDAGIKPCGIPIELADFIIRAGQYFGTNKLDLEAAFKNAEGTTATSMRCWPM